MKKTTFTDTMIRKLKPAVSDYSRSEGNGFTCRVMPSGSKTWLYLYVFDGTRRKMNLGSYPEVSLEKARRRFDDARRQVKNGVDPLTEKEQALRERQLSPTVSDLITEYIEKHAKPHKRGWMEDKRILEKDALPAWGKRKAKDIKKRDVVLLLEKIVERGSPGSANNNFKIIRKMFRFAVQRDILEHSPCDGVVMPAPLNRGDRVLTEKETQTFWNNLDTCHASDEIRRALRLILVTGQRPGEVIGMHRKEIIDGRWWFLRPERCKNKQAHMVYLTDTALDLIGDKDGFIFESPVSGKPKDGKPREPQPIHVNALAHVVRRNRDLMGVADFTPHDLRRTASTFMSKIGFSDEVIDAVLNHSKQGIIRTYNLNSYSKEKQAAMEAWERKLQSIITGAGKDNVVSITTAKGKDRSTA